ncbi:uncharacterized protein BO97DRAFT_422207 [Aspergillus homomorphus CBS 101889]|uniref:Uncharacterized protein n=1 Tax=Aspergillus homomorphus (strain CBS 101889) TaxID=1450537 RepID=A0A395I5X4_ASPHC|nr:hypothetical protein BO97DRAFT_422207 [Aspergillus homomorphus CBS 101889]RAL14853.1 hypothetical protein BO97DRAFT_422207 [Aspergillus homomorphus CBS 101889]
MKAGAQELQVGTVQQRIDTWLRTGFREPSGPGLLFDGGSGPSEVSKNAAPLIEDSIVIGKPAPIHQVQITGTHTDETASFGPQQRNPPSAPEPSTAAAPVATVPGPPKSLNPNTSSATAKQIIHKVCWPSTPPPVLPTAYMGDDGGGDDRINCESSPENPAPIPTPELPETPSTATSVPIAPRTSTIIRPSWETDSLSGPSCSTTARACRPAGEIFAEGKLAWVDALQAELEKR